VIAEAPAERVALSLDGRPVELDPADYFPRTA
jgi:hypothetical protein